MKTPFILLLALLFASCSGYFNDNPEYPAGNGVDVLALADGSGYLSSDQYNEITPFIFKDTNTGKKWLFFASDRSGNYDVYYAELFTDGKFSRPVKMDANFNTANQEFSPVVFCQQSSDMTYRKFITLIRVSGTTTNLVTSMLKPDFSFQQDCGSIPSDGAKRISIRREGPDSTSLVAATGSSNWNEYYWSYLTPNWDYFNPTDGLGNGLRSIISADCFMTGAVNEMSSWVFWYVFSAVRDGRSQIYAGGSTNYSYSEISKTFYPVGPYQSAFNDRDPFVDEGDAKIYFSSDRFGKGNYDLYRHNVMRYTAIQAPFLTKAQVVEIETYPMPQTIGWDPVPGAKHYLILFCPDGESYTQIADVTGTSFTHTSLVSGWYYYRVQAVSDFGYSESDTVSGLYGIY